MASEFAGKRILVTGGANGVGKAILKRFYDSGATLFTIDYDEVALKQLKTEFPKINTVQANLQNWNNAKEAVESILPLNHLVNCAGIMKLENILECTEAVIDQIFGINFKAAVIVTQAFAKGVIEHKLDGGTIVNISSVADRSAGEGYSAYSCSKAAITMFTRSSATELGKYNIRVNSIRPKGMNTNLLKGVLVAPSILEKVADVEARSALSKSLEPSDVANAVYFLSSSQSALMTGEDLALDGGAGIV